MNAKFLWIQSRPKKPHLWAQFRPLVASESNYTGIIIVPQVINPLWWPFSCCWMTIPTLLCSLESTHFSKSRQWAIIRHFPSKADPRDHHSPEFLCILSVYFLAEIQNWWYRFNIIAPRELIFFIFLGGVAGREGSFELTKRICVFSWCQSKF